jgi:hypothetical protein
MTWIDERTDARHVPWLPFDTYNIPFWYVRHIPSDTLETVLGLTLSFAWMSIPFWQRSLFVLGTRRRRDLCLDLTRFLSRMCKNCHDNEWFSARDIKPVFAGATWFEGNQTVVWRQSNVSRPDKTEKIAFFCSSVTAFTVSSLKISIT